MEISMMELDQSIPGLLTKNDHLNKENKQMKMMISLLVENIDLRTRMQTFNSDTLGHSKVCSPPIRQPPSLMQTTTDEKQFSKDLQQTRFKREQRTSSPTDMKSFMQRSVLTDAREKSQNLQADVPLEVKDRVLGEIAYQLDRRILSYIFQGQKRLYGFTLINIPEKILEVSTHPLTGKVDKGYRLYLSQRYTDIMEQMNQLGYKTKLHSVFSEFIVNSYGMLRERPCENCSNEMDYNNPELLRKLIMATAQREFQKHLLLLLTCLCHLAEKDRKPIFLW